MGIKLHAWESERVPSQFGVKEENLYVCGELKRDFIGSKVKYFFQLHIQ
jgi:hypothetical protein